MMKWREEHALTNGFVSSLDDPRRRFLAALTDHGLAHRMRSCEDFLRHFSPRVIMAAIGSDADLRAELLEQTLGMKKKVGLRKSPTSAGDDLQIALEEGVTTAEAIVELFGPDHRARCLDGAELWAYVVEPEFWQATRASEHAWQLGRDHIAYILERALAEQLITPREIVESLTLSLLVEHLPGSVIERVLAATLRQARIQEPFSEDEMLDVVPPAVIAEHVPLALIWERVIVPSIAEAQGLVAGHPEPAGKTLTVAFDRSRSAPLATTPTLTGIAGPPRMPSGKLPGMPAPMKLAARASPPPFGRASSPSFEPEEISSSTKRSSRAPRRSVPPKR